MTPRKARHRWLLAAGASLVALAVAAILVFCVKGQYLLLRNAASGSVIFSAPAGDGDGFSVSFIHSVNKSPVSEHYEIRNGKIYLTELRYKTFGAGMPTQPEDGQTMRLEQGYLIIGGFEREMPYLCYFIGRSAGHVLNFHDTDIALNTLDEPGQPASFTVIRYPRFLAFLGLYFLPAER